MQYINIKTDKKRTEIFSRTGRCKYFVNSMLCFKSKKATSKTTPSTPKTFTMTK